MKIVWGAKSVTSDPDVLKALNALWDRAGSSGGEATITTTYNSGTSWYRKWSDGFIEQAGTFTRPSGGWNDQTLSISFPISFTTTSYKSLLTVSDGGPGVEYRNGVSTSSKNTSGMVIAFGFKDECKVDWYVFGY